MSEQSLEVNEADFEQQVIARSNTMPVVVDFWAPWCAPCRQLGPLLESECQAKNGAVVLVKINVDNNQDLAMRYQVSGIPAVKVFQNGQVVSEFVGALPAKEVKRFFDALVPSEADKALLRGKSALEANDLDAAELAFKETVRAALALTNSATADLGRLGLVQTYLTRGAEEQASAAAEAMKSGSSERAIAEGLLLRSSLRREAYQGSLEAGYDAVEACPDDLPLRWSLAARLVGESRYEEALRELLEIVKKSRAYREDGARKAMLSLFALLGPGHEMVSLYRRRLSLALF